VNVNDFPQRTTARSRRAQRKPCPTPTSRRRDRCSCIPAKWFWGTPGESILTTRAPN